MFGRIRAALAEEGLQLVRPVSQGALDLAGVPLRLADLLPEGRTGLVIGDGGGAFFARFCQRGELARPDPLDEYTREIVTGVLTRSGGAFAVRFPFSREQPLLPMQRLGQAAGLPARGPLGLQIHPRFGPWWAYRAFAVFPWAVADEPPLPSPCEGCPAPCVAACPGGAVEREGLALERCVSRRLLDPDCQHACAARLRCPVGAPERYPADQLRFHMAASWRHISRLRPPG